MKEQEKPSISISISRTIPVEQYGGKAECFISLQGITVDTTPEEIEAMLEQGQVAYSKMVPWLKEKMRDRLEQETQAAWKERGVK